MVKLLKSLSLASLPVLLISVTGCGSGMRYSDQNVVEETYVHKYGVSVPQDFWASAGEHGAVISTMADGVVVSRSYSSGTLDGETTSSYPHSSQIQKKGIYERGELTQETEFFYDGTPKRQVVYHAPSPEMTTISTWYLSGTPKSIERYSGSELVSGEYYTSLNQKDALVENGQGIRLVRDDYGQLTSTDTLEAGQLVLRQTYHPNGSPKEMTSYKNELVDGVKRTYLPAGEPNTIEQWSEGQQQGMTIVFQHGEKYAEVPYSNGEKHGIECRYRDGTTKVQEVSWSAGQMHGPTTTFVGNNEKTEWYYKGKAVSKPDYEFMTDRPAVK